LALRGKKPQTDHLFLGKVKRPRNPKGKRRTLWKTKRATRMKQPILNHDCPEGLGGEPKIDRPNTKLEGKSKRIKKKS